MIKIKELKLKHCIVLLDDEDYEKIPKTGWYLSKSGNSKTAYITHDTYGRLHRYILNVTDPNLVVDHIDRNGLNNQKNNLRIVTTEINKRNQNVTKNNKFNFNGINYEKSRGTHSARIKAVWNEFERESLNHKRNKMRSKSFSISKYGFNEAVRLALIVRIQKMREFNYLIDERSETIEREIQNPNIDIQKLLNISFESFE